jgi:hypothetical protein
MEANDRHIHPSEDRTINEAALKPIPSSNLSTLPMSRFDNVTIISTTTHSSTTLTSDEFVMNALAFLRNSKDTYPIDSFVFHVGHFV